MYIHIYMCVYMYTPHGSIWHLCNAFRGDVTHSCPFTWNTYTPERSTAASGHA